MLLEFRKRKIVRKVRTAGVSGVDAGLEEWTGGAVGAGEEVSHSEKGDCNL